MKSDSGSAKQYRVSKFAASLSNPGAEVGCVVAAAPGSSLRDVVVTSHVRGNEK